MTVTKPRRQEALDNFLQSVQKRAFVNARMATGHVDEAMDIVQDAMIKLVDKYGQAPSEEWPYLFQRILQNRIRDWYRRQKVRGILFWWQQQEDEGSNFEETVMESKHESPAGAQENLQTNSAVNKALQQLPVRQQQAFLLRAWWEYDTKETAEIMGCSQGSVKTHYSRATKALKDLLNQGLLESGQWLAEETQ